MKEQFTVQRRKEIYLQALQWFENNQYSPAGLCIVINKILHRNMEVYSHMDELLPELYAQKPDNFYNDVYWFSLFDRWSRIECLKRAIELCTEK